MDALSSQIYAIQLPAHLLAQPSAPAPFLPEDIHICGNCKQSFTDIRYFLQHKNECNAFLSSATAALLETASSSVNLQMLGPDQPLLQVMINEESQSVLVQTQENDNSELNVADNTNGTANVLAAATTLLECGNVDGSNARRDIQIDEEDVASLLANQFAKEAVYIPPDSPSLDKSGTIVTNEIFVQDKDTNEKLLTANCDNIVTHLQEPSPEAVENVMRDNEVIDNGINNCINNDGKIINYEKGNKKGVQSVTVSIQANNSSETPQEPSILPAKRLTCCNLCSFVTMYPSDLTRHMRKHTGERPFQCNVCSQRFPRRDKLQTHLRIHTGEKPYRCQFCDYAAIDSGPLRKHLRTHTDERPFKCQFCPYSAKDTSQLTVHLRTHTGDAPFICQFEKCGRAFKTSTDLKRHGVVHKRVHPFACKLCDYKASNKLNLQAHYQLSHNAVVINDGIFKCVTSGCDFETSNVNDFQEHQQKLHPVPDMLNLDDHDADDSSSKKKKYNRVSANNRCHTCTFCSHEARNQSSLKRHVRKQHSNSSSNSSNGSSGGGKLQSRLMCQKTHHCTYCLASFVRQDSLRSHLKQHLNNNGGAQQPSSPSKDMKKQQVETVSASDLIANNTFFIENILEDDYIQITT